MTGFGGVVSFLVRGDLDQTSRFIDACRIAQIAPSLGGVETLIEQPALMSFYELTTEQREAIGIRNNLVRMSVGIEDCRRPDRRSAPGVRRRGRCPMSMRQRFVRFRPTARRTAGCAAGSRATTHRGAGRRSPAPAPAATGARLRAGARCSCWCPAEPPEDPGRGPQLPQPPRHPPGARRSRRSSGSRCRPCRTRAAPSCCRPSRPTCTSRASWCWSSAGALKNVVADRGARGHLRRHLRQRRQRAAVAGRAQEGPAVVAGQGRRHLRPLRAGDRHRPRPGSAAAAHAGQRRGRAAADHRRPAVRLRRPWSASSAASSP